MSLAIKVLASNQLGTSASTAVYSPASVSAPKVAIVKAWRFTNTSGSPVTINAYFQKGGGTFNSSNARFLLPPDFLLPAGNSAVDDLDLTLGSGDGIYAAASAAS